MQIALYSELIGVDSGSVGRAVNYEPQFWWSDSWFPLIPGHMVEVSLDKILNPEHVL